MRDDDNDDDDLPPREDRLGFSTTSFRRKLGEGLAGLLDPDGALGRGKEIVTGVTSATKNEVVRMISAEVRQFLDGMDTVELLQRVVAGLVIDVKAEIRFSIDPDGALKSNIKTEKAAVKSATDPAPAKPAPAPAPTDPRPAAPTAREPAAREPPREPAARPKEPAPFKPTNDPRLPGSRDPGSKE